MILAVALCLAAVVAPPQHAYAQTYHVGRVIRQINQSNRGTFSSASSGFQSAGGAAGCICAPIIFCAQELRQIQQQCALPGNIPGVCCPPTTLAASASAPGTGDNNVFASASVQVNLQPLDNGALAQAFNKGIADLRNLQQLEERLFRNNIFLQRGTPAYGHLRVFTINPQAKQRHLNAFAIAMASVHIMEDLSLTARQGGFGLQQMDVRNTILGDRCPSVPNCNLRNKYRTADGSCNNPRQPTWGQSNTPVQRILPARYDDGVFSPRSRSTDGSPLPNPRVIASNVLVDVDNPDQQFTSSVMQWAQFLDHDFAHIPFPVMGNGEGIECCPGGREAQGDDRHPMCMPINTADDRFLAPRGSSCMNFVRSMFSLETSCNFGHAEQLNQLTHWIDGSNVYGSTLEEQRALRTGRGGLLKTSGNNMLPINPDQGGDCTAGDRNALCLQAGDSRVNEQPGLTAIHTLWLREHNRVARTLQQLNPSWPDEAVFQQARRIIVAEMQHITYNEWLPIIVGPNFMREFGINVRNSGFSFDYNPNINANMNNEFSTAAFRFGHTLVQGTLRLFSGDGSVSTIQLRDHFNSPHLISRPGMLDPIVRSFTQLAIQKFDPFITQDLTNHLFQTPRFNFGMDLMSLNIQRGRDHAIATYNDMRQICGLKRANNFQDITDQIPTPIAQNLARVYKSVDDIDFFVGGISERPVSGGLLGWTFLCVVGDQFARLKKGDRFFYDLGGQPSSFTEAQLQEIRRSSWARIICDNSDNIQAVQPLAFMLTNTRFNQPIACDSPVIPRPNLEAWRGEVP
ncbi:LOW QUALITY PROTEIN: chorion peroxidase-like [Penaeus chinensis]|uniref:LOW QUALITY PROTEIN: chorion peroxidase-like n=1 Tax=Penaeus chinensis TaxID=139456 RepID=UPI001FB5CA1C|nr:LOW QUALITY PROTEIN: chorion peroxidase-like [Penaeus chinensis]